MATEIKSPTSAAQRHTARSNRDWWPDQLDLQILHQHSPQSNPTGKEFNYGEEFKKIRPRCPEEGHRLGDDHVAEAVARRLRTLRAPFHPHGLARAGTYRIADGRGGAASGTLRFAPLNSWPDNVSLDKARRLLWRIKQKYGKKISWADLIVLAGNCALESMGLKTFGYAGGREDVWESPSDVNWGHESTWLGDERYTGNRELARPFGAVQMALIYVNPEGPNGKPDPLAAAKDIRETFRRMAMNDEETVALIAGGNLRQGPWRRHAAKYVGREPEGASIEELGLGWKNTFGTGKGADAITSGLEGAWTSNPVKWDNGFFDNLFGYDWEVHKGPGGAWQWKPKDGKGKGHRARPHDPSKKHTPMMFTTDLALKMDPIYADLEAVPRKPGRARRRLRESVVQAHAPRYGARLAVARPARSAAATVARPGPRGRSRIDRRAGDRPAEGQAPRLRPLHFAARGRRRGRRPRRSAAPTSGAEPTEHAFA